MATKKTTQRGGKCPMPMPKKPMPKAPMKPGKPTGQRFKMGGGY